MASVAERLRALAARERDLGRVALDAEGPLDAIAAEAEAREKILLELVGQLEAALLKIAEEMEAEPFNDPGTPMHIRAMVFEWAAAIREIADGNVGTGGGDTK